MSSQVEIRMALLGAALALQALPACQRKTEPTRKTAPPHETTNGAIRGEPAIFPGETLHRLGETVEARDYKFRLEDVEECTAKYYFKPKAGNIKLGVEVVIEGTAAERHVPVNPFNARLTDSQGASYTSAFAGCEPELKSRQLAKGEQSRGWITFEIPEKSSGLKLTYAPFVIGAGKQEIHFDLER